MANRASAYGATEALTADPFKLILILYDACIKNLHLVNQGIDEKNIVKRSEALYKAVEIINELLLSVEGETEQAAFLRGLYLSILVELPKVNLTNDKSIIDKSIRYISELRRIWREEVIDKQKKNNILQNRSNDSLSENKTMGTSRQMNYSNMAQTYQKACIL